MLLNLAVRIARLPRPDENRRISAGRPEPCRQLRWYRIQDLAAISRSICPMSPDTAGVASGTGTLIQALTTAGDVFTIRVTGCDDVIPIPLIICLDQTWIGQNLLAWSTDAIVYRRKDIRLPKGPQRTRAKPWNTQANR